MPTASVSESAPRLRSPWMTVIVAWLLPGAGHFLLGKRGRGAILAASVLITFAVGLAIHGPMFQLPSGGGDVISRLIQYGGFLGDVASGALYFIAVIAGYDPPDLATHNADYGSKLLVAAGLMNILAMVDAYEIATRQKD